MPKKKSTPDNVHRLHKDPEVISEFLDCLDETSVPTDEAEGRRSKRYRYRAGFDVELELPAGRIRYQVPSRNLNRAGASFLLGLFVYPNTICHIHLVNLNKQRQTVTARVVRCRYIEGSSTLHEVGVSFFEPIDVTQFIRPTVRHRFLLVDDDPNINRLVEYWSKTLDTDLTYVESGLRALEVIETAKFDVVLLDLEMPDLSGFETAEEMWRRGFSGPIIALSALTEEKVRKECQAAGFTYFLAKPIAVDNLIDVIESLKEKPLFSSLADDPEMSELIDQFVKDLSGKVDKLKDCFAQHDYDTLARITRMLKGGAGTYGFQPITDAAAEVEKAINENLDESGIRVQLDELIRICTSACSAK